MTPFLLSAVLLAADPDPAPAYVAWVKAHPTFKVHVAAAVNGKTESQGDLLVQRPVRLLYKAHGASFSYTLGENEYEYIELEGTRKIYDEYPAPGGLTVWGSDISGTANGLLPRALLVPSLAYMIKGKFQVTKSGSNQVVYVKNTTEMGVMETWMTTAADGHLVSARRKAQGRRGSLDTVWTFTDYAFPSKLSPNAFRVQVPSGYVPNSVPRLSTPLQTGRPAPVSGWSDTKGHSINLLDAAGHKSFLIAYVVPDDGPAQASLATLHRLQSKLPVFVVGPDGLRDRGGKGMKQLNPPGAPTFYLIGGDGKVSKIWFGYDRANSGAFESDVIASLKPQGG